MFVLLIFYLSISNVGSCWVHPEYSHTAAPNCVMQVLFLEFFNSQILHNVYHYGIKATA